MLSTIGSIASQNQLPVWDKYNAVAIYSPNWGAYENVDGLSDQKTYPSYVWTINQWQITGEYKYLYDTPSGTIMYTNEDPFFKKVYWLWTSGGTVRRTVSRYSNINDRVISSYEKGTLVQAEIRAPIGTYPDNGRHTDGYWYVKRI